MKRYFITILLLILSGCGDPEKTALDSGNYSSMVEVEEIQMEIHADCIWVEGEEVIQITVQHNLEQPLILRSDKIEIFIQSSNGVWTQIDQGGLLAVVTTLEPEKINEVLLNRVDFSNIQSEMAFKITLPLTYLEEEITETVHFVR